VEDRLPMRAGQNLHETGDDLVEPAIYVLEAVDQVVGILALEPVIEGEGFQAGEADDVIFADLSIFAAGRFSSDSRRRSECRQGVALLEVLIASERAVLDPTRSPQTRLGLRRERNPHRRRVHKDAPGFAGAAHTPAWRASQRRTQASRDTAASTSGAPPVQRSASTSRRASMRALSSTPWAARRPSSR